MENLALCSNRNISTYIAEDIWVGLQEWTIDQVEYKEGLNSTPLFPIVIALYSLYYMENFKFLNMEQNGDQYSFQVCFIHIVSQANNR